MSEYTPGPWELHHQSPELMASDCDWSLQSEEAGAFLLFCHHPSAPAEANARLIAAAPEMLAALIQIENALTQHNADRAESNEFEQCNWDFGEAHGGSLDVIRAAIAKATAP